MFMNEDKGEIPCRIAQIISVDTFPQGKEA
jgi:hypothetical protein